MSDLFRLIYASRLSPACGYDAVPCILLQARRINMPERVSGLLVFDGEHFGQCLEGELHTVAATMRRIQADPRHIDIVVVLQEPIPARHFKVFGMAYSPATHADRLADLRGKRADEALPAFLELQASLTSVDCI